MTVDEQLRQAFDALVARARDDMAAQVSATIAGLSASIEADRAQVVASAVDEARTAAEQECAASRAAAVTAAEARVRTELSQSIDADRSRAVAEAVSEARTAAEQEFAASRAAAVTAAEARVRTELSTSFEADRARAVADAVSQARIAAEQEFNANHAAVVSNAEMRARADVEATEIARNARLRDAITAIDRARSLSDVLDLLVAGAAAEAARAAVFLPERPLLRGWRLIGFDAVDGRSDFTLPLSAGGVIADALETGRVVRAGDVQGSAAAPAAAPAFAELPADRPAVAVPLVMAGQTCAILYVDQGASSSVAVRSSWRDTVEVLARHAGRSLEAITASRLVEVSDVGTQWLLG